MHDAGLFCVELLLQLDDSSTGSYSLSIRDVDEKGTDSVKHYKIRMMDNGGFYISPKISFSDIGSMIKHYHSEYSPELTQRHLIILTCSAPAAGFVISRPRCSSQSWKPQELKSSVIFF